jgi:AdoMet-dependent heme synthase
LRAMEGDRQKLKIITFEVTRHCKYHCPHCRWKNGDEKTDDLPTLKCKKILKAVADFAKCIIVFSGGEPMERPDIYELIRCGRELGLQPILATCGYLINEKSIEKLKQAGVNSLAFSLDGAAAQTHDFMRQSDGSFDQILRAVEITRKASLPFQINTTVTKYNLAEVHAIVELAAKLGASCFNPFILVPGRDAKNADLLLDSVEYESLLNQFMQMKLKSPVEIRISCGPLFAGVANQSGAEKRLGVVNNCTAGSETGFISYKGDVQPCIFLENSAGNLIEGKYDFAGIWQKSKLLMEIRDRSKYTGRIAGCGGRVWG